MAPKQVGDGEQRIINSTLDYEVSLVKVSEHESEYFNALDCIAFNNCLKYLESVHIYAY